MSEQTPRTLDRLWDDIPTGHAPIDHLLASGRAARRRTRRTIVAGAAAMRPGTRRAGGTC